MCPRAGSQGGGVLGEQEGWWRQAVEGQAKELTWLNLNESTGVHAGWLTAALRVNVAGLRAGTPESHFVPCETFSSRLLQFVLQMGTVAWGLEGPGEPMVAVSHIRTPSAL